jgi:hypothetical protein
VQDQFGQPLGGRVAQVDRLVLTIFGGARHPRSYAGLVVVIEKVRSALHGSYGLERDSVVCVTNLRKSSSRTPGEWARGGR